MKLAITKGINMEQPWVKKEIVVRTETSLGYSSLSLTDEKAGVMLFIEINKDVKELLKEIVEAKY